jgi:prepilin-type N-terminal cleavage/methylation domain-containing protein
MKNLLKTRKAEGFTIIEVMIVLAIAGLIMVIVFIAVPQLQRNQRDNARQNTANRVESEMETFAGNNQGQYPVDGAAGVRYTAFVSNYYNAANFQKTNPKTGANYTLGFAAAIGTNPTPNQMLIYRDANCNGENAQVITGGTFGSVSTRSIAVRLQLDNGSTYYCVDNG